MSLNIVVIYGSTRIERQGIKGAKFIIKKLEERKHKITFIDPLEYRLPLLEKMYKSYEKGKAPETLEKLHKIMEKADAYVIVSAEYNHGVPPALKNIIDHFMGEGFFKPALIAAYSAGPFGGARVTLSWRAILPETGIITVPSTFLMSAVQSSFDDEGNPKDPKYNERIKKPLDELEWYAHALKKAREKSVPYK